MDINLSAVAMMTTLRTRKSCYSCGCGWFTWR